MQPLLDLPLHGEVQGQRIVDQSRIYRILPVGQVLHGELGVGHIRHHLPCTCHGLYHIAVIILLGEGHAQAELLRVGRGEPLAKVHFDISRGVGRERIELHRRYRCGRGSEVVVAALDGQRTHFACVADHAAVVLYSAEAHTYFI